MKKEEMNYYTECRACKGVGELPNYDSCPACNGEGEINRLRTPPEGYIRLREGVNKDFVTYDDIPVSNSNPPGFEELYGDESIDEIISSLKATGNDYTATAFEKIKNEKS